MQASAVFLKIRTIALGCLALAGFLWVISLCVVLFTQWDVLGQSEKSIISLMLVVHIITTVMLLVLLILPFRPWLDAARVMFLLVAHIGAAGAFAYYYPRFTCLTRSPDQEGLCGLIIAYILIVSWVIPVLLVIYAAGLALMLWKRKATLSQKPIANDEETRAGPPTIFPSMSSLAEQKSITFSRHLSSLDHLSNVTGSHRSSQSSKIVSEQDRVSKTRSSRLSKPLPVFHF